MRAANASDTPEARRQVDGALTQIGDMRRYQAYGARGKWKHWWRGDWLTDISSTEAWLDTFKQWLDDPIGTTPLPMSQTDWKAYYHILRYQGNRSVDVS